MDGRNFPVSRHPAQRSKLVHRADAEFPFLHDTMIARLGKRLFCAWYNCTENEIVGRTVIRGRWSDDEGASWSEPEIVCEDARGGLHMVPATFAEQGGVFWAYVTRMRAHDRPEGYVCARYDGGGWRVTEERDVPVLLNTLPQPYGGGWLAAGRMAAVPGELPLIPVIAASPSPAPGKPADWTFSPLPGPWTDGIYPFPFPETAVLAEGPRLSAFVRSDTGAVCFESADGGRSWGAMQPCALPIAPAKVCGGTLPDGRQYLIYNERTPAHDRSRLVLALREGSGAPFSRGWLLADGADAALGAGPHWHYPCACVSDGWLHVSCTASSDGVVRHAALFSLPAASL